VLLKEWKTTIRSQDMKVAAFVLNPYTEDLYKNIIIHSRRLIMPLHFSIFMAKMIKDAAKWLRDIRFWILLFFLIRMVGITYPPIEAGHNWRQSFTCMVARNFLEIDPNIFYPRIDHSGDKPGIIASEFPVFNYLIFLSAKVFGYDHWYGRLINLIISSLGVFYFYLLVKKYFRKRMAFFSGLALLVSIWFMYSRKIMPDTFSVSLTLMALYYGLSFLEKNRFTALFFFLILASLGGLSKIPATLILSLLIIPLLYPGFKIRRRIILALAVGFSGLLISAWYFYWVPYLLETYQNQLYFPFSFSEGLQAFLNQWQGALEKFYFESFYSFAAFGLFLAGLILAFRKRDILLKSIFLISFVVLLFFAIKTGNIFPTHNYYIIPFVPVMALFAGYALDSIPRSWIAYGILAVVFIESMANQHIDFRLNDKEIYKLELEGIANKVSHRKDLIAITGDANPQELYFANRKGWILGKEDLFDEIYLDHLRAKNCKYLFVNRNATDKLLPYTVVYKDKYYIIYKL
jgi:hypothetical protein